MNIGNFNRLSYDNCAYDGKIKQSTDPLNYRLSVDQIHNCDRSFFPLGPRNSSYGVSTAGDAGYAISQNMVDVDSILSNRNVKQNKCRNNDMVNPIDPTKFKGTHANLSNNRLNPEYTKLSHPSSNYRGSGINRFYDTIHNAQDNLFWNFETNSTLEARDNFVPSAPQPWDQRAVMPRPDNNKHQKKCNVACSSETDQHNSWTLK